MNISAVIARHKSIFHASPPPTQEAVSIEVEVPPIKEIPSTVLPKKEKLSAVVQSVENNEAKSFTKPKNIAYPKLEGSENRLSSSHFQEEGLVHYLRQKRACLPQNMEADNYD